MSRGLIGSFKQVYFDKSSVEPAAKPPRQLQTLSKPFGTVLPSSALRSLPGHPHLVAGHPTQPLQRGTG